MSRYFKYFPTTTYNNRTVLDITRRVKVVESLLNDPYAFLPYTISEGDRPEDVAFYYYGDQNLVWMIYLANSIMDPYSQWPLSNEELESSVIKKYSRDAVSFANTAVSATSDSINIPAHGYATTDPVIFTSGVVTASPLSSGTTYYVIRVDSDNIKLASSASNSISGNAIDITTPGFGEHSIQRNIEVFLNSTQIRTNVAYVENIADPTVRVTYDTYLYGGLIAPEWNVVRVYDAELIANEDKRAIYLINAAYAKQVERDLRKVINE